jgi:hypothetical protein
MPSDSFNGTTVSIGGTTIGKLRGVTFTENGNEIDATDAASTFQEFLDGIPGLEAQLEFLGKVSTTRGTTGALVVNWNDGTTSGSGPTAFLVCNKTTTGSVNAPISSTLVLKPAYQA